ncbi:MAG: Acetolactate synthase small subunit [Rhodanobacteraceae bacterium]|jgi:acetolactate synthase-1/3 small subunit|nr:MAG: Acetolactate synthase small subunit [Rhodanobacteraceae bacterium]
MKHTLSILLQNEAGALARVAGLFAARHVNIDTLNVAPTHDPAVSHLTVVLHGSDATLEQIVRQIRKLVDVVSVRSLALFSDMAHLTGEASRANAPGEADTRAAV